MIFITFTIFAIFMVIGVATVINILTPFVSRLYWSMLDRLAYWAVRKLEGKSYADKVMQRKQKKTSLLEQRTPWSK